MLVGKKNRVLIANWKTAKTELDKWKKIESNLRDKIVDKVFPERTEGNNHVELSHGFSINCKQTYRYDIDEDLLKDVLKELPRGAKKKLIKTTASLIKKGYTALDQYDRAIVDHCLTLTPSKPQLEIIAPKEESS